MKTSFACVALLVLGAAGCGGDDDASADAAVDGGSDAAGDGGAGETADGRDGAAGEASSTDELLSRLRVPAGFQVSAFARDMGKTRFMTVLPDGTVFVTRREEAPGSLPDIWRLRDSNGDGVADVRLRAYQGIEHMSGVANNGTHVFMMGKHLYVAPVPPEGALMMPLPIVFAGQRQDGVTTDRGLGIAPDGQIYISVAGEMPPVGMPRASLIRARVNGAFEEVFATGMRNALGFDWHPVSGELWATEQGSSLEGAGQAPDEINKVGAGSNHGWPICVGKGSTPSASGPAPATGTKESYCAQASPAVLELPPGSGASSLVFYDGAAFPAEYKGDAFVALSGGQSTPATAGFKVVRVRFGGNQATAVEDFLTGFLAPGGAVSYGRPQGLAVAADGALLVSDEVNGIIYRISRSGAGSATPADAGAGN